MSSVDEIKWCDNVTGWKLVIDIGTIIIRSCLSIIRMILSGSNEQCQQTAPVFFSRRKLFFIKKKQNPPCNKYIIY